MPEVETLNIPADIIQEHGPRWQSLVGEVTTLKQILGSAVATSQATERALMGGWNSDKTAWVPGVRDDVRELRNEVIEFKTDLRSTKRLFWAVASGVWAVALIGATEFLNSVFGWFGAAHAAAQLVH